jgi:glycosyltransferase involved in cell wall biosynthesis
MKLVHVCPRYYPYIGGIETHVREICERLSDKGFDVTVCTTDPSGKLAKEETRRNVKINRFRSWAPGEAYYFSDQLRRYLLKNSEAFDIVHAHAYSALPALYAGRAKRNNKLVFTPHYHETGHTHLRRLLHVPYKHFGKMIFKEADTIICVSRYERDLVTGSFELIRKKVVVIPNGVDLKQFENLKKSRKGGRKILYVGRLEKYKGVQYLLNIIPRLDDNVSLEIVGQGPYKDTLLRLSKKLGILNQVTLLQDLPRDELLQKYVDADLFVLLSQHEAYGISVAEALCAKTPCIVARTSALQEWVDWKNCFGIDFPIDLDKLANLAKQVIGRSVETPKVADWDTVTKKVIDVYESIARA